MLFRKKKVKPVEAMQTNVVPLVNTVIFRQRVKTWHYSNGMAKSNMRPCETPAWALNHMASMGIEMLGVEVALKHAESLAVVGIMAELPETIRTMAKQ